jgi:hypothetical protein
MNTHVVTDAAHESCYNCAQKKGIGRLILAAKIAKTTLAMSAGRDYALRSFWENPQFFVAHCHEFETIDLWQLKFA